MAIGRAGHDGKAFEGRLVALDPDSPDHAERVSDRVVTGLLDIVPPHEGPQLSLAAPLKVDIARLEDLGPRLDHDFGEHEAVEIDREYPIDHPGLGQPHAEQPFFIADELDADVRDAASEATNNEEAGRVGLERRGVVSNANGGARQGIAHFTVQDLTPEGDLGRRPGREYQGCDEGCYDCSRQARSPL